MTNQLYVREAISDDCEVVWQWWNDPLTRKMMKKNDYVPWEEHCSWFEKALHEESKILCMGILGTEKVGVVRFDLKGEGIYEVSINLNPHFRGKGLAPDLLDASIRYLLNKRCVHKLFATLKRINAPSMKTFTRAGFVFVDNPEVGHAGLERYTSESEFYCERFF